MLALCPSPHGLGHVVRSAEVARALRRHRPDLRIRWYVADPSVLARVPEAPADGVRVHDLGAGAVQRDALRLDLPATARTLRREVLVWDARADALARAFGEDGIALVVADVPPLAFDAAGRAGIPAVAVGNFGWDFVYAALAALPGADSAFAAAAERASAAYARARLLLRLPLGEPMAAFPVRRDVALVARRGRLPRGEVRRALGLAPGERLLLASFGGEGLPVEPSLPRGWRALRDDPRFAYPDLVAAADAVLSKPGYGIVTDCLAACTPLLWMARPDWPEEPILREALAGIPSREVSAADLADPRALAAALEAVGPLRFPDWPLDGAEQVAEAVLGALGA